MIGEKRFLRSIQLRNLLSFGPDTPNPKYSSAFQSVPHC
jgi:hypothetical protein